jgi:8-oxo-dGTP pyrophosphatase MutT (NUDIX family)
MPTKKNRKHARLGLQYAALAIRTNLEGKREALIVTSLDTRRWIIPKGWPIKGCAPQETAAREAFEEAGVTGKVEARTIGSFDYDKRLSGGGVLRCRVEVFPLMVTAILPDWPERGRREMRWVEHGEVAALEIEDELRTLLDKALARRR